MLYVLKFDYDSALALETKTKLIAYSQLEDATRLFEQLELSYQFKILMRVKDGRMIKVTGVWLYEVFTDNYAEAVNIVRAGAATLLDEAREIEIDIEY